MVDFPFMSGYGNCEPGSDRRGKSDRPRGSSQPASRHPSCGAVPERAFLSSWLISHLCPVMETVSPGLVPFREQLRLGLQPVLHLVPGQRTLVHITEVGPSGHLLR